MTIKNDVRSRFLEARDQGARPTCTSFALSDAHSAERPPHSSLSTEYLFHHAAAKMPRHTADQGISIRAGISAMKQDGQPVESAWPYSKIFSPTPSLIPTIDTPIFKAIGAEHQSEISEIRALLAASKPAVIVIEVTPALINVGPSGFVYKGAYDASTQATHAVVAVACGDKEGKSYILVRNSWGILWGIAGHAWLSEEYLAPLLKSVTSLDAQI